jgi:hypothetical protein
LEFPLISAANAEEERAFFGVRPPKIDAFPREEKQFCGPVPRPRKLLDHVRDVLRVNHYSVRTEEAYSDWRVNAAQRAQDPPWF